MPNNSLDVAALLDTLDVNLKQLIQDRYLSNPLMIGIRTGGVWVAQALHTRLAITEPLGLLDISFYRDDFSQIGINPNVKPSHLPHQIDGRNVILVDDVFYTGRTIRAALNEIFDYGRPAQVILAVLLERNGRQIPIRPDCYGASCHLEPGQRIKLTGPAPLALHLETIPAIG
ncbi:MAG: bifunctional pyr operon transcriptional regulator/uracil phosphoribosyltransferase PyrR [Methylococcaceae bacterium]|nr:bifunctional pyr operon transcriptional regulator/uracil phosphoribosyltransferase PyrR [Methylococcaceae bacterium]